MKATLILVVLTIVLSTCSKKTTYTPVDAELKTNFWYKVGTYWVYRDSLNGEEDSFYVAETSDLTNVASDNNGNTEEEIDMKIYVYDTKKIEEIHFGVGRNLFGIGFRDRIYSYVVDCGYNIFSVQNHSLFASSYSSNFNFGELLQTIPKFTLNGKDYNDVYVFHHKNVGSLGSSSNDTLYINEQVGIIQMRINHSTDSLFKQWKLERFNIIR